MILSLIIGYVIGRIASKKSLALTFSVLLGALLGLTATYTLIPLLYPIFTGDAGLIVIPEFDSIGIMFLIPDFVIYNEIVYMLTRSYIIDFVFLFTGVFFTAIGAWLGSTPRIKKSTLVFEQP
jgi:hypothetical protein